MAVGLGLRLGLIPLAIAHPERSLTPDSQGYLDLATSLRTAGTFKADPYTEEIRTPGYPLFIAAVQAIAGPGVRPVIVAQVILSALVGGLLYLVGSKAVNPTVGWASAFLWAANPNSIFWPFVVLSEALFAVVLAATLLATVVALRGQRLRHFVFAGLLLSVAVMVRPIALYLILLWTAGLLVFGLRRHGRPRGWQPALAFAIAAYSLVVGWGVRNYLASGEYFLSKTPGVTLRSYILARALADARGISRSEAAQTIPEDADLGEWTRQIFSESPWSIPRVMVGGLFRTALGTEAETWLALLGQSGTGLGLLTGLLGGDLAQLGRSLAGVLGSRERFLSALMLLWGGGYALVAWSAAGVAWLRRHSRLDSVGSIVHWLAALAAIYLVAVPLANGDARFRVPVDPFLAILAGVAWLRPASSTAEKESDPQHGVPDRLELDR